MRRNFNKKSFIIWISGIGIIILVTAVLEFIQLMNLKDSTGYFPAYALLSLPIYFVFSLWVCDYNKRNK